MAYLKATEILTRARELVEKGLGSFRAIDPDRFTGSLHEGVPEEEATKLGLLDAKPAEVSIGAVRPHPQRLTRVGNINYKLIDLQVRVVRTLPITGQVDDETRDAIKALAAEDADALDQVFGWPANLATTQAGDSTDWKGTTYAGSAARLVGVAGNSMRFDTVHRFTCTAVTRPATS